MQENTTINSKLHFLDFLDEMTFVKLFYKGEIELKGYKTTFTQFALKHFLSQAEATIKFNKSHHDKVFGENKKEGELIEKDVLKQLLKEKEEGFYALLETYNEYIIHGKESILYTSFNESFLDYFFSDNNNDTNVSGLVLGKTFNTKEEKEKIFSNFNIINNIFIKYIAFYKTNVTEFDYLLNKKDIDIFGDIILRNINFLKNHNKSKITENEEFLIRKLLLLTLNIKTISNDTGILLDNNMITIQLKDTLFMYDTIFYVEFIESLEKLLNLKDETNKDFIKKIYRKIEMRIKQLSITNSDDDDDENDIINNDTNIKQIFKILDKYVKKYKIKIDNVDKKEGNDDDIINVEIFPMNNGTKVQGKIKGDNGKEKKRDEELKKKRKEQLDKQLIELYKKRNELKKKIKKDIFGQEEVIDNIFDNHINKLLLNMNKRPLSFIFAGDSGLGKTELAKKIGIYLGWKSLHLPMGNYKSSNTDGSFLGAPPSYVGYEDKTILEKYLIECEENSKIPVIIFDEIEKGHPSLQTMYLELFDEGKLTFLNGNTYDLSNAIIIMTSNLGIQELNKTSIGFDIEEDKAYNIEINKKTITEAIKQFFKPEILNRITDIMVFKDLNKKDITNIINNSIKKTLNHLNENVLIKNIFGDKLKKISVSEIKKELQKIVELNNIENIRKIETETEKIIISILEKNN